MKAIVVFIVSMLIAVNALAQHDYTNPRKKKKRGLLEEPEQEKAVVVEEKKEQAPATPEFDPQTEKFCACEKSYFLQVKRLKLYKKRKGITRRYNTYNRDKYNYKKATEKLRAKYDIDDEFNCGHKGLSQKKLDHYKREISLLKEKCDLDLILE